MKIKGLKSTISQVTFIGEKHPTTGCVSEYAWHDLKQLLEHNQGFLSCLRDYNNLRSIKITPYGLQCYWSKKEYK